MNAIQRRFAGAATIVLGLLASTAHAGTSAAPTHNSSSYALYGGNGPPSKSGAPSDANINYASAEGLYVGVELLGLSQLDTESILFKNGVVVAGRSSNAEMKTGVAITFTNTNATRVVRPVVTSTLLAAGLGLYVTTDLRSPYDIVPPGTCTTSALLNCGATTGGYYSTSHWANSWASFEFDVSVGGTSIYSLNGKVGTDANGNYYEDMDAARAALGGFTEVTNPGNPFARGYKWDDTAVKIALPDALNPGETVTAIYSIRTAVKIGDTNYGLTYQTNPYWLSESQIAYAAFGDPTGGKTPISTNASAGLQGAGVNSLGTAGPALDLSAVGRFSFPGSTEVEDPITGVKTLVTTPVEVYNPVTTEYELVAKVKAKTIVASVGGVPEPANWAMLIAGFGLTGTAMRRRRAVLA
jgi:hypothetical protein